MYSISGVLWKECTLSTFCATSIGFSVWRMWQTCAQKWTWVLAAIWFAFGFLIRHEDVWGGLFPVRSGTVLDAPDARSFFAFTIHLIRGIFYSVGAYIPSMLHSVSATRAEIR